MNLAPLARRVSASRTPTAWVLAFVVAACSSASSGDATPAPVVVTDADAGTSSSSSSGAPVDADAGPGDPTPPPPPPPTCPDRGTCTFTNTLGMELRALAGGTFTMGGNAHPEEQPTHPVTVSPFAIGKTEVTYAQWTSIVTWGKAHGYAFDTAGDPGTSPVAPIDQNPVTDITWWDALRACNALSEMEGRKPAYYTDAAHTQVFRGAGQPDFGNDVVLWQNAGYRLPTEAEWEYAYRGGTTTEFWWGNAFDATKEWVDPTNNCALPSHPVGSNAPNPFGLYDIGGNVHEMVWDLWPAPYASGPVTDPKGPGPGGYARVTRGGNLCYDADYGRAAYRRGVSPSYTQDFDEGFRVVLP